MTESTGFVYTHAARVAKRFRVSEQRSCGSVGQRRLVGGKEDLITELAYERATMEAERQPVASRRRFA